LFTAKRDLAKPMRELVLGDSGMALGKSQVLIELYGAVELPGWRPKADAEGYVPLTLVKRECVHDTMLLFKHIGELQQEGFLEVWSNREFKREFPGKKWPVDVHPNGKALRITDEGANIAGRIWQRYCQMAEELMEGFDEKSLRIHQEVNEQISDRIPQLLRKGLKSTPRGSANRKERDGARRESPRGKAKRKG
jgi:hypothetical protein